MILDTITRIMRYVMPKLNNRGFILINRNPDPAGGGGGGGGNPNPDPNASAGGGGEPSWVDVLPDEAQKDPEITKYKTPEEFYNGYREKVAMIGKKGVIVPAENATPEETNKFFNSIGRPDKPEGYKFAQLEGLHETIKVTPEAQSAFSKAAHEAGLTNKQLNHINGWYLNNVSNIIKQQEQAEIVATKQAETALRQEWGEKFDTNRAAVSNLMLKVGGQELVDSLGGVDGLGNKPLFLKALGKIAGMLSEDQINSIQGPVTQQGGNETKEQALAKIKDMNENTANDLNKALFDEKNPKHDEAVMERQRLYKIAYGGEA